MNIDTLLKFIVFLVATCKEDLDKIKGVNKSLPIYEEEKIILLIIINSWVALEGFLNLISSLSKYASRLETHEISFLKEENYYLDENGEFFKKPSYNRTSQKIVFLLNKFSKVNVKAFRQTTKWNKIKEAEDIRNSLIHPKNNMNFNLLKKNYAEFVLNSSVEMIKFLNNRIYKSSIISKI